TGDAVAGCVFGAVIGVVSNVNDPDRLGRIKVRYPWLKDDSESSWARIVSFMAGPGGGGGFRPGIGGGGLGLFDHGRVRFPYVLGGLWNGKDEMPKERGADSDNSVRLIKSRSGHQILLDDSPGAEKVTVTDKAGNSIEMSSTGVVIKSTAVGIGGGA